MPLYEYKCEPCHKVHEVMQKFSDAPLSECPDCNGPVEKLVSLSSFALKGSGWYTTDYKRAGTKSTTSTAASGEGSSAGASTTPTSGSPATSGSGAPSG